MVITVLMSSGKVCLTGHNGKSTAATSGLHSKTVRHHTLRETLSRTVSAMWKSSSGDPIGASVVRSTMLIS